MAKLDLQPSDISPMVSTPLLSSLSGVTGIITIDVASDRIEDNVNRPWGNIHPSMEPQ